MNTLTIKQEITLLRSAVISLIGRDTEGEYRPEFIKSTLAALSQKATRRFTSPKQFLKSISKA
ncbi:MAG: hypothetical protein NT108_03465 [Candidatus Kaiserbacteria bacterium]|nr:hypothetical protein [Candidatus Kaiserbacteria bacterium]